MKGLAGCRINGVDLNFPPNRRRQSFLCLFMGHQTATAALSNIVALLKVWYVQGKGPEDWLCPAVTILLYCCTRAARDVDLSSICTAHAHKPWFPGPSKHYMRSPSSDALDAGAVDPQLPTTYSPGSTSRPLPDAQAVRFGQPAHPAALPAS